MGLVTFEGRHRGKDLLEVAARNPSSIGDKTLPVMLVAVGPVVLARVNAGRWIADCPDCAGAEYVSFENAVFFCCECRNAAVGNRLLPVAVPDAAKRSQVESYLLARPDARTRNWTASMPVTALRDENREHGVRLPKR